MSRSILLRPEVEEDVASGRDWYDRQRQGLGEDFVRAVNSTFQRIADQPKCMAMSGA